MEFYHKSIALTVVFLFCGVNFADAEAFVFRQVSIQPSISGTDVQT